MIKPMLEDVVAQQPMLDEIVIEELDLGPHPMRLAGLKVYDTKDDEVIMEAPVQWGSSVKVRATLTWRRAQPQACGCAGSCLLELACTVFDGCTDVRSHRCSCQIHAGAQLHLRTPSQ